MAHVPFAHDETRKRPSEPNHPRADGCPLSAADFEPLADGGADIPDIPLRRPEVRAMVGPLDDGDVKWFIPKHDNVQRPLTPASANSAQKTRSMNRRSDIPMRGRRLSPIPSAHMASVDTQSPSPPPSQRSRSTRSRVDSIRSSFETNATSLMPLQTKTWEQDDHLEPLMADDVEPGCYDLVVPEGGGTTWQHSMESRSEILFSKRHLSAIFSDFVTLQQFTDFLAGNRPESLPLLNYYIDSLKALRSISYANALAAGLKNMDELDFTAEKPDTTINQSLRQKSEAAFDALVRTELPAYITHVWTQTVTTSIRRRITGTLPAHLREMSEGLAEVFCLTDPSRKDNPIIMASEEFYRTTQYGVNHVIGRNCRFLQGPGTNPFSVQRIRDRLAAGKDHVETFLNYRRDGSPFMNLLMMAPLYDDRGTIRYFLGAQVDVSGLISEACGLDAFHDLLANQSASEGEDVTHNDTTDPATEFDRLSNMFNSKELEAVRRTGGSMYRVSHDDAHKGEVGGQNWHKPRMILRDESWSSENAAGSPSAANGKLSGVYSHYLLLRPYPNLRILFASPSLRTPGILQRPFLSKIGGSSRVIDGLRQAFSSGHGVTAKIHWLSGRSDSEGRVRWIHCTPLLGSNGAVGVWMVVFVDDEIDAMPKHLYAPPVAAAKTSSKTRQTGAGERFLGPNSSDKRHAHDIDSDKGSRWGNERPASRDTFASLQTDLEPESPHTLRLAFD